MKDLSLHLLDIAQNSIKAGATVINVTITECGNVLALSVADNGCGMTPEFLEKVLDPFTTTRTTRKVGLGLPLLKLSAEQTGGSLVIDSQPGVGTTITATYISDSIDAPPLGDIAATMQTLIHGAEAVDFIYRHDKDGAVSGLSTIEIREQLGGDVPINLPDVLDWIYQSLKEQEENL